MDIQFRDLFIAQWKRYFPGADLPLVFFYSDQLVPDAEKAEMTGEHCMICELRHAQNGRTVEFGKGAIRCAGGLRYTGFSQNLRGNFRYFLSTGDDRLEGERYKKSPELVDAILKQMPHFEAPHKHLICKRWDMLVSDDMPELVCFLAPPDVLSGLFTLANYDRPDLEGVVAPFGSGCSSVIFYPYHEIQRNAPRAVLGMFDVSARPCVSPGVLSLTMPYERFCEMAENIVDSFLITESWSKVNARFSATETAG